MNPHQKNKIDVSSLSADEQRLFRMYGKLPNKKDLLQNKLKERKYFDSGDYALSKAGKTGDSGMTSIGTEHPTADTIPHTSPLTHIITRGDSVTGGSPPGHSPSVSQAANNPLSPVGAGEGASPTISGPSPAGMNRGSINGIPGASHQSSASLGFIASRSPVKESYLNRSASIDDAENEQEMREANDDDDNEEDDSTRNQAISPPPRSEGIPIRR